MPTEDPQQRLLLEDRRAQHGGVFGRALPPGSSTGAAVDDMSGADFDCAFHEGLDEARAVGRGLGPRDEPPPQLHSVAETACGQGSSSLRRTEMSCERTPAVGESPVDGKTEAAMHVHEYLTGGRAPVLETQPGRATAVTRMGTVAPDTTGDYGNAVRVCDEKDKMYGYSCTQYTL